MTSGHSQRLAPYLHSSRLKYRIDSLNISKVNCTITLACFCSIVGVVFALHKAESQKDCTINIFVECRQLVWAVLLISNCFLFMFSRA